MAQQAPFREGWIRRLGRVSRCCMQVGAFAGLLALVGCASTPTASVPQLQSSTSVVTGQLPRFTDWRGAYLASDGKVHVVSLDGKTDLTGPTLPHLTSPSLVFSNAGIAPDGRTVAYAAPELDLVDVTGHKSPRTVNVYGGLDHLQWSPDGTKLLSYDGPGQFTLLTLSTGQTTALNPGQGVIDYKGWIDNTHIATISYLGASYASDGAGDSAPTSVQLDSVDVTSGQVRTITTVRGPGTPFDFAISPDGSLALSYDVRWRAFSFSPQVSVIDLATGNVTPLPNISDMSGASFKSVAWRPGTGQVAVTTQVGDNRDGEVWMLDTAHDSATEVVSGECALAWTPDGSALALSNAFNGPNAVIGEGPDNLEMLRFNGTSQPRIITVTDQAVSFPFIGFARNP